jgi:Fe-S-cluster containining protein
MNNTGRPRMIPVEGGFKFSCHKDLPCFNSCCADINIFLTPYDLLRMRRATGLSSIEFLREYTIPLLSDEGLPLVVLKMVEDDKKSCPFVSPDGCKIYRDRPWSCRMYPLFPSSSGEENFYLEEKDLCLGLREDKWWTIPEWRRDQGIEIYDRMNELYREITFHEFFLKGNRLEPGRTKMIYMACYNLDEFKRFIFERRLFDIYDLEEGIIERLQDDEEELLNFGYRWIRFNLFGDETLKLKDETFDRILKKKRNNPCC